MRARNGWGYVIMTNQTKPRLDADPDHQRTIKIATEAKDEHLVNTVWEVASKRGDEAVRPGHFHDWSSYASLNFAQ